jgi:hypothetical protein
MKSKLFSVNWKDGVRGLFLSVMTSAGIALQQVLNSGLIPDKASLRGAGIAGIAAGLAYIIKNFLTNSNDEMLKVEPTKPADEVK